MTRRLKAGRAGACRREVCQNRRGATMCACAESRAARLPTPPSAAAMPETQIRAARPADLPALLALEALFPGDRLSPRQFRHHLRNPRARLRALRRAGRLVGYALL